MIRSISFLAGGQHAARARGALCAIFFSFAGIAPASAATILSEVFYDAAGADDGYGFVELAGEPGTLLDGLQLAGVNGYNGAIGPVIELAGVIGPDGLFLVADQTGDGSTFVAESDLLSNFDFQNGPDSIVLLDGETVLDALGYGVFGLEDIFAGEGSAAPDAPAGSSLARLFADLDTDDNSADFEVLGVPTPGTAVFQAVPEPAAGLLLVSGLVSLSHLRRRRRVQLASGRVARAGAALSRVPTDDCSSLRGQGISRSRSRTNQPSISAMAR